VLGPTFRNIFREWQSVLNPKKHLLKQGGALTRAEVIATYGFQRWGAAQAGPERKKKELPLQGRVSFSLQDVMPTALSGGCLAPQGRRTIKKPILWERRIGRIL